ncbi:MAG: hypothetical protein JWN83_1048 [Chitinophagaceae bacterium]|nr:hypothetical protein [Chitinophagaceae bacterium]
MNPVIADEAVEKAEVALSKGEGWMAYDNSLYFIDRDDVHFFHNEDLATGFAENKFLIVSHLSSIRDLFIKIERLPLATLLEKSMQQFDWRYTYYDPLEANTEAETEEDKKLFSRLEQLLEKLKVVYHSGEGGKNIVENLTVKYWSGHPVEEQKNYLLNLKTNVMNQENLDYLKDNMKYMGFGENLHAQLENHLKEGKDAFQLGFRAEVNKKPFEATLHFGKSESTDKYFFNSFDASLQKGNGEKVDQTFYLNKGKGVTAKEAFNLLDGRAVHKELTNKENVPYKAWLQLDFQNKDKNNNHEVKQFHENYGYNLKEAVNKFSITELNDPKKEDDLMKSLQKGNVQSVTIEKNGTAEKMFVEANPQFKTVNLYDGQMKRVQKENLEQYKSVSQSKGISKDMKQDQKQDLKQEVKKNVKQDINPEMNGSKKKSSRRKGMSV